MLVGPLVSTAGLEPAFLRIEDGRISSFATWREWSPWQELNLHLTASKATALVH